MYIKVTTIITVFFLCAIKPCAVNASSEYDEEVRELYEKTVELYEKIERENAHLVHVNGITMGYLDFGPKKNAPLIWAHGSGWTSYEILNVKDELIASGYRVIAIDYRGHGKTQIQDFNTSLYDVADDIAALMDHLTISKAVIGGWSKGGFIAAAFYDEYPARVLGLLLEDGGSWSGQRRYDETFDITKNIEEFRSWEKLNSQQFDSRFGAFRAVIGEFNPGDISMHQAINILSKFRLDDRGKWVNHLDPKLLVGDLSGYEKNAPSLHPLMQWSQQAMIPEIIFRHLDVPMLIIDPVSENDSIDVSDQNRQLKNQHPRLIRHQIYQDTGHAAHLSKPKRFVQDAQLLLSKVKRLSSNE